MSEQTETMSREDRRAMADANRPHGREVVMIPKAELDALREELRVAKAERDAQLSAIQSWRISANLARHHDEALMHLAKRAPSQKGEAHE